MDNKRIILLALPVLAALALTACRGDQKQTQPVETPATQTGQCPKLDGSYFGSDKGAVKTGEAVALSWKVPREYAKTLRIEGIENSKGKIATGQSAQLYDREAPPLFSEGSAPEVRPTKTTTFILKAAGPQGCQPLELPATVKVE